MAIILNFATAVNFTPVKNRKNMKFFGRQEQIAELGEMKTRSYENHSMLTVVTGRRRIGKTTLISKAMGDACYVYFFVGKKNVW